MKKFMAMVVLMTMIFGSAAAELDHWDSKTVAWLTADTENWLYENGYEKYATLNVVEDELALGYGIITKDDLVFSDAHPSTISGPAMASKIEELFNTTVHSIECVHLGQRSGYEIYELVIKWNDPVTNYGNYGEIYGLDFFVRFYN